MEPIAVTAALLRAQLPDVPLREGATMMARVASRSETGAVIVIALRMRRSRPGLVQISPQALRVIRSWKSAVKSVVLEIASSTCSSPSTSRRTSMPR